MSASEGSKGGSLRLVIGLVVAVLGVYWFVNSMTAGGVYYLTVDEAHDQYLVQGASAPTRPVRIKGLVAEGSWVHKEDSTTHTFAIKGDAHTIEVFYDGPMPDVFGEGREVTAEGQLDSAGLLTATEVTAKCPSKYEGGPMSEEAMKRAAAEGKVAPHPVATPPKGTPPNGAPANAPTY